MSWYVIPRTSNEVISERLAIFNSYTVFLSIRHRVSEKPKRVLVRTSMRFRIFCIIDVAVEGACAIMQFVGPACEHLSANPSKADSEPDKEPEGQVKTSN